MNRREFVGWVGVGGVASCLPVAIAACSPQSNSTPEGTMNDGAQKKQTPASSPRADGFQVVGSVADLDKTGELMVKDFVGGAVVVVRDPKNPNIVMAVSPTCTHQGCAVTWKADKKAYLCPCHGSGFSADGQVLTSPATRALKTFTAKLEGDSILVKG